jgi:hypothetical protein
MKKKGHLKECFGMQADSMLDGQTPEDCLKCEIFDTCHKITVAAALQGIAVDLSLLVQNGLDQGWLKSFDELDEEARMRGLLGFEDKRRKYDA